MRKIFTLLILLLLLPVTALAEGAAPDNLYVGNQELPVGLDSYWTTSTDGKLITCEATNDWNVAYDAGSTTLTLKNATIKGVSNNVNTAGTGIYAASSSGTVSLNIVLEEENRVSGGHGINVSSGAAASLSISGSGSLTVSATATNGIGILVQAQSGDANLTINGANVNAVVTETNGRGVELSTGQVGNPNLTIEVKGGSLQASGQPNGIKFFTSANNTYANANLKVSGNAMVKTSGITTEADGSGSQGAVLTTEAGSGGTGGIVFNGSEGTVYGDVTLQEDLEIGEGESLTIGQDANLTVPSGTTLTNNGTVTTEGGGTLTNNGKIDNSGTLPDNIQGSSPPKITTASLLNGTVGTSYSQTLASDNNPTNWSVTSGSLPDGLSLNSDGTITGTPTAEGTSTFTVKAENSVGSDSKELMLTVTAPTTYTITAEASPAEGGTVTVNGGTSSVSVEANSTVNLVATPNAGYRFTGWTSSNGGTFADASSVSTTFTMPANDVIVTAGFEQYYPVTSITLDKSELSLYTGNSETLTATIEPDNATNKNVTWSSDNADVAIVNNGTVKAMGAGDATITVTTEDVGKTATCVVQVRKPATVEASGSTNLSFTTDRDEFTLTATVQVNGDFLNPTENSWKWSVANEDVVERVTLRSKAVSYSTSRQAFTIKGTGTTTITATYDDGIYRGLVNFTVRISKPTPPDPISYYNIYIEDVCDGVEVSTSKNVVREGGSVSVYVKKDTVNYTFDNFKVYYKRSYYGTWDELKEGTQPGEYPIKNIWNHIYIKAEGAEEKEDPTGIESIEGVKVYTKDGSLYVQTPQREQVIIVSMSGAVVKNEEQVGLKQYHGLQLGIYIVRVGDRAYKLRLN